MIASAVENPPDLASNPASIRPEIDPALPTLFVAGDSTAAKGKGEHQQGWATPLADYFNLDKINVVNRARGGRSSRTFITEGLWDQLIDDVKTGDIVIIQFGHNDIGSINEEPPESKRPARARASLPGLGEESQAIDNIITHKHEIVYTFAHYMRQMIKDVKSKKAHPVLVSLTLRDLWEGDRIERGNGRYGEWIAIIAEQAGVPFIDLSNPMADQFEKMGKKAVSDLFEQDYVHFNAKGANMHAAEVVAGLKNLSSINIEDNMLSEKGKSL